MTGPISSVVYAVEGGMEDWGYSAGWENDVVYFFKSFFANYSYINNTIIIN